eukprot:4313723-Pleurochrysis_carterae.AAC.3
MLWLQSSCAAVRNEKCARGGTRHKDAVREEDDADADRLSDVLSGDPLKASLIFDVSVHKFYVRIDRNYSTGTEYHR